MNWIHLHLALNHIPVIGTMFVALLLFTGMLRRSEEIKRLALWWLAILSMASIAIKFTGDFAAENATKYQLLDTELVAKHEQSADQATTGVFLMGIMAAVGLFCGRRGKPVPHWANVAVLVLAVLTFLLLAQTANNGGQIRHPEVRPKTAEAPQ